MKTIGRLERENERETDRQPVTVLLGDWQLVTVLLDVLLHNAVSLSLVATSDASLL